MNRILVGMAALALAGVYGAYADVLEMEDGRRIRGELISVNRGEVIFDEARPGSSKPRRLRLLKDDVTRIVLSKNDVADDEDLDPMDDGPFGPARDDPRGSRDDAGRDADRDAAGVEDGPFGRNRDRDLGTDDRGLSSHDRMITVPARQAWTDTGIDVKTGDVVRFAAEGTVLRGPGQEDGPAGEMNSPMNDRRPVPARPAGALIGRIGTSPSDVFFIGGDRGSFRVRTSGRLYLGVNDNYYADNSGSFEVRVSH
jgi:hypothetical protein